MRNRNLHPKASHEAVLGPPPLGFVWMRGKEGGEIPFLPSERKDPLHYASYDTYSCGREERRRWRNFGADRGFAGEPRIGGSDRRRENVSRARSDPLDHPSRTRCRRTQGVGVRRSCREPPMEGSDLGRIPHAGACHSLTRDAGLREGDGWQKIGRERSFRSKRQAAGRNAARRRGATPSFQQERPRRLGGEEGRSLPPGSAFDVECPPVGQALESLGSRRAPRALAPPMKNQRVRFPPAASRLMQSRNL